MGTALPFATDPAITGRKRLGLVVLANDYTIEGEAQRLLADAGLLDTIDLHLNRIDSAPNITPQTLAAMGPRLTDTADAILPGANLAALGYGCTSASVVLGSDWVDQALSRNRPGTPTTNPAKAAIAAFRQLDAKRIAILTPYTDDVNAPIRAAFESAGPEITALRTFNEPMDPIVAAIDTPSLTSAIEALAKDAPDAVFVSCTSIRLIHAIERLEESLNLPITSSNHALIWHMLRLADVSDVKAPGRLFRTP